MSLIASWSQVEQAAHLYVNYAAMSAQYALYRGMCEEKGLGPTEIVEGAELGHARQEVYHLLRGIHGDPMYGGGGSWNSDKAFDLEILSRRALITTEPARGLHQHWLKAEKILTKYAAARQPAA